MTDRAEFEKWFRYEYNVPEWVEINYEGIGVAAIWKGWQACAALSRPSTEMQPHSCALEPEEKTNPTAFDQHWAVCGFVPDGANPDHIYAAMQSGWSGAMNALCALEPAESEHCLICNVESTERPLTEDLCEPCDKLLEKACGIPDSKPICAQEPAEVTRQAITQAPELPSLPKPDIRIDAFGDILPTDGRMFVRGDFYTADQMRDYALASGRVRDVIAKPNETHSQNGFGVSQNTSNTSSSVVSDSSTGGQE
jgi:hypothetical protein